MADQYAIQDPNQFPALTAHSDTTNEAETRRVVAEDGRLYVGGDLIDALYELIDRLAPLAGAMSNTAQLRAVVTGAVTATGGGYITSAQNIANILTQTNSLIASRRLEQDNILPTLANVNNCIGR